MEGKKKFLLEELLLIYNYFGFLLIKSDEDQKEFNIIKKKYLLTKIVKVL
jgi:hypothetical protein